MLSVDVHFDPEILQGFEIHLKDSHILKSGIKTIAPNQIFAMRFPYDEIKNHILEIDPNNTHPLETTIKLSYFDIERKEYLPEYKIDLDNYKNAHIKGGNSDIKKIDLTIVKPIYILIKVDFHKLDLCF
ncbi:hypothetical protein [Peribacillus simplex]|uniref:hypothetical protein n=1 Tax=Peribacillus simplex TaxID=1478 RepID=UPI000BA59761|nr:hypothetical protein [Peribacillus simplex]PAK34472.1 hypothetical protein CHI08_25535 [Peribacillus simplex]